MKTSSISLTAAVEDAVAKEIKSLKTKVHNLEARIKRKDIMITNLKRGASFSRDTRNRLLNSVNDLVTELQDQGWIDIDRYYAD